MKLDGRNATLSTWLLILGGIAMFATAVVGFLNHSIVNGENFAEVVNKVRQDDAVKEQVGIEIGRGAVDARPDLVAIQPAIAAASAAVVGSPVLDPVFTPAIKSFHTALTKEGGDSAVLTLADLGSTLTTALKTFAPDAAASLPDNLNVVLADVGGQEGLAAQIIPFISVISTLAWILPLVTLLLLIGAVWLSEQRRVTLVRLGWMLIGVSGGLLVLVLGMNIASLFFPTDNLQDSVTRAALQSFSMPLGVRALATAVVGGLLVAGAGALLPQVDVGGNVRRAARTVLSRPKSQSWQIVRALSLLGVAGLILFFPTATAQIAALLAGVVLLAYGATELDVVAEQLRSADEARSQRATLASEEEPTSAGGRRRVPAWVVPTVAGLGAVGVLAALIVPQHLPQTDEVQTAAGSDVGCNGYVELCDKPFSEVVIAASHNSMSVADGNWYLAEQPKDMVSSLDDGIRGLLVDTWYGIPASNGRAITAPRSVANAEAELRAEYGQQVVDSVQRTIDRVRSATPTGEEQPYFCHTVCELGATAMKPEMQRLNAWLEEHPRNVVVLFLQDTVTPADTDKVLRETGLADRAYVHVDGQPWPTLGQMIDQGKQVFVLMENQGGGAEFPYLHQGFDVVQDTEYTFNEASDFTCTLKRGQPDSPMFNVNHWLASFAHLVSNAEKVNTYEALMDRVKECDQVRDRAPSMISVNWYDKGDLFQVVNELNGVR